MHFPSSRAITSRFTFAGTVALLFFCCATSSSSAAVSTCSSVARGWTCDWPAFAFFSKATNSGLTVMWIRLSCWVSGSTTVLRTSCDGPRPFGVGRIAFNRLNATAGAFTGSIR